MAKDRYVVRDTYGKLMMGPTSKTGATQFARMMRAQSGGRGGRVTVEKANPARRKNPKSISLKNFTGKITRLNGGAVSIKGRAKK